MTQPDRSSSTHRSVSRGAFIATTAAGAAALLAGRPDVARAAAAPHAVVDPANPLAAYRSSPRALIFPPGEYALPQTLVIPGDADWQISAGARLYRPGGGTPVASAPGATRFRIGGGGFIDAAGGQVALDLQGYGHLIDHLRVGNATQIGYASRWTDPGVREPMEAHVYGLRVAGGVGIGLLHDGPHDSVFVGGESWTLQSGRQFDAAVRVTGRSIGSRFLGFHTWGRQALGWDLLTECYMTDCTAEGAAVNVRMLAKNIKWSGGTIFHAGPVAAPVGVQFGTAAAPVDTCSLVDVKMHGFPSAGIPIDFQGSYGNRVRIDLRAGGVTWPNAHAYRGSPGGGRLDIMCLDAAKYDVR